MTVDESECRFESFQAKLGPEYGREAGYYTAGVRVTHLPTGTVAEGVGAHEFYGREAALSKLTNMLASPEQKALVDAMSWSNADCYLDSDYATNNGIEHKMAADILRGLEHLGWRLVGPAA